MKMRWIVAVLMIVAASTARSFAEELSPVAGSSGSLVDISRVARAVGSTIGYSLLGIMMSIVGFKLFDRATPFHLEKEIVEERNVAAAVVSAAMILGVSIIVAFTILS